MRRATVMFRDRSNNFQQIQSELTFTPKTWSWLAVGGCDAAEIEVAGPSGSIHEALNLLGYGILISNEEGDPVWWGRVEEVEVSFGGLEVGLSLANVYTRVAVNYVYTAADGSQSVGRTAWKDDAQTQARYGVREKVFSFDGLEEAAILFRDAKLVKHRHPEPSVRSRRGKVGATLHCLGPWHFLKHRYFAEPAGLEEHLAEGSEEQAIGATYVANTIRFEAQDDLYDSAGYLPHGFGALKRGHRIWVSGAVNQENNGEFTIHTSEDEDGEGHLETTDKNRVDAATGPTITLGRSEFRADRIAMPVRVTTPGVSQWPVASISIPVAAVDGPTDNLIVDYCEDAGGSPGNVLDSAQIAGSALSSDMTWVRFDLSNQFNLWPNATRWIVVRRSGNNSLGGHYVVRLNDEPSYAVGTVKVYTGSAWVTRDPAADLPFRIEGREGTLLQITKMVEQNPDFGPGTVDRPISSNVLTWQYREGDRVAFDEIEKLLELGTSSGQRLLVDVYPTPHSPEPARLMIYPQPEPSASDLLLNGDGSITQSVGGSVAPIPHGISVARRWLHLNVFPAADALATRAIFAERAEYDAETDFTHVDSLGAERVFDLFGIGPG